MGKKRGRWKKGSFFVIFALGVLFAGIFVSNYFQAKAASNETTNLRENHQQGPTSKELKQNTKDNSLEKERMQKQKEQALAWEKQKELEEQKAIEKAAAEKEAAAKAAAEKAAAEKAAAEKLAAEKAAAQKLAQQTQTTAAETNQPATSGNKTVYLTFDDGPAPFSPAIIALLEKYHYKATFFMIDGNIRKYPNSVKLMVKNGETVGLHSVSHNVKTFYASVDSVLGELNQNRATLKQVSGIDSLIARTPYGSAPYMTDEYKKAVKDNGYIMWDWNIDSKDWYYKDARYVTSVIDQLNRMENHKGPIVILMHERKETLAHLPQLLDYLSKHGYTSKAVDASMIPVQFR